LSRRRHRNGFFHTGTVRGASHRVADLIAAGKSILFLGAPGAGKSTALRDAASFNPAPYIT
jgi:stage III sporulation protein SpoIIIAA